ncbi:hypothetical protein TWF481_010946 [Arthrobotrys musiformis]|uniref:Uncharacterized protein n=1 Tax=Arthrobotrys musiformis TaxID=47236 RepID=A0AAV9VYR0_9PEZI
MPPPSVSRLPQPLTTQFRRWAMDMVPSNFPCSKMRRRVDGNQNPCPDSGILVGGNELTLGRKYAVKRQDAKTMASAGSTHH